MSFHATSPFFRCTALVQSCPSARRPLFRSQRGSPRRGRRPLSHSSPTWAPASLRPPPGTLCFCFRLDVPPDDARGDTLAQNKGRTWGLANFRPLLLEVLQPPGLPGTGRWFRGGEGGGAFYALRKPPHPTFGGTPIDDSSSSSPTTLLVSPGDTSRQKQKHSVPGCRRRHGLLLRRVGTAGKTIY